MPINIYIYKTWEELDWLCDEIWDLPTQIEALESWLVSKGKKLSPNKYVADIGFDINKNSTGGGGVLNSKSMGIMARIGMDIYFSEYHSSEKEQSDNI